MYSIRSVPKMLGKTAPYFSDLGKKKNAFQNRTASIRVAIFFCTEVCMHFIWSVIGYLLYLSANVNERMFE